MAIMLLSVHSASAIWVWETKKSGNWSSDHYSDQAKDENQGVEAWLAHSGSTIRLEVRSDYQWEHAKAEMWYDTSEGGTSDGYTTFTSSADYRAKITFDLAGTIDSHNDGDDYSYLKIKTTLYYYSGGVNVVGTDTFEKNSGSFSGASFTVTTSSGNVDSGYTLHIKVHAELYAESTWGEHVVDNDFYDGGNGIELQGYEIQEYVDQGCNPFC